MVKLYDGVRVKKHTAVITDANIVNAGEGSNKDIGETVGQENNGFEHLANISILLAEMSALECTYQGCTGGPGGAKYKTPALEPAMALEMLKMHDKNCHSQVAGPGAGSIYCAKMCFSAQHLLF